MTGFEPVTSSLPRKCSTPELHRHLWAKMDSNHRRHKPADLQSAPFGHSGIRPALSLLSDSNQRPRDYKSRALANWAKEAFSYSQVFTQDPKRVQSYAFIFISQIFHIIFFQKILFYVFFAFFFPLFHILKPARNRKRQPLYIIMCQSRRIAPAAFDKNNLQA